MKISGMEEHGSFFVFNNRCFLSTNEVFNHKKNPKFRYMNGIYKQKGFVDPGIFYLRTFIKGFEHGVKIKFCINSDLVDRSGFWHVY